MKCFLYCSWGVKTFFSLFWDAVEIEKKDNELICFDLFFRVPITAARPSSSLWAPSQRTAPLQQGERSLLCMLTSYSFYDAPGCGEEMPLAMCFSFHSCRKGDLSCEPPADPLGGSPPSPPRAQRLKWSVGTTGECAELQHAAEPVDAFAASTWRKKILQVLHLKVQTEK